MAKPDLSQYVQASSQRWNVDPALAAAVMRQESGGDPSAFNPDGGGQGAAGAMQVRQATLADYNKANGTKYTMTDLKKPDVGIDVGTWYLGQNLDRFGDPTKALIAYKQGPNSEDVQKGTHPYATTVMGMLNQKSAAPKTLPGIPTTSQPMADDDAIFSAFSKGASNQQPTGGTGSANSDDAIFSAFQKAAPEAAPAKPAAPVAAPATPQTPFDPQSKLASFGAGLGYGVGSTALGIQQLLGHGLSTLGAKGAGDWLVHDANTGLANLKSQLKPYEQANPKTTLAGNIGGSIGASLPLTALAPVTRGASLLQLARGGAIAGGLSSLASPVENDTASNPDFFAQKAKQAALGAATGGIVSPTLGALGKVISPNVSPQVKTLMDKGVTPTPGQILGGGAARTEEKLTSVPVLGDFIKNAQQRGVQDFNRAAYNEALAPIGKKFSGSVGQEGIEEVGKTIGKAYDDVLPKMQLKVDPQFISDVSNLTNMAKALPDPQQKAFEKIFYTQIFGKLGPQQTMDGIDLKGVQSELSKAAKGYLGDQSYDQRQLGAAVNALKDAVESNLARVNPPELAQQLSNANQAWANFVRLRTAAASTGAANNGGIFTAAQLQNAVRAGDKSVGKGAFATGNALMQDLSSTGQSVLGSKYPDSGTAGRGLMALLTPTSLGAMAAPGTTLATLGGIATGSLPYTELGQRLAAKALTSRPGFAKPIGNLVQKGSVVAVPGAFPLLFSQ